MRLVSRFPALSSHMNMHRFFKMVLVFSVSILLHANLTARENHPAIRWGWGAHRAINAQAVQHLPAEMFFWLDHGAFLSEHAPDPDTDDNPSNWHWIDIDYYPEFFAGTLPHTWEDIVQLYGEETVQDVGIVPWTIDLFADSLQHLMTAGNWSDAWQVAAELGHYIADAHQPLHLTQNYNGQLTGNYGIHSRYETQLINPHLDEITYPDSTAEPWGNILDSTFRWIAATYPHIDAILATDDQASDADPGYGSVYYQMMWEALDSLAILEMRSAAFDVAAIWTTAWIRAGQPLPPGVVSVDPRFEQPSAFTVTPGFPNPFNPSITFRVQMDHPLPLSIRVIDLAGRLVEALLEIPSAEGVLSLEWTPGELPSGVYIIEVRSGQVSQVQRVLFLP